MVFFFLGVFLEETDFGQSVFGHPDLANPFLDLVCVMVEPRRVWPRGWGPKFRAFFALSRRKIRSFLPSLGVSPWNFGGV